MGVGSDYVRRLMVLMKKTYSLECPLGDESDYTLLDILKDVSSVPVSDFCENVDSYELGSCLPGAVVRQ